MREWDGATYHRVSAPQFDWGRAVLERLPLRGDEIVADVGSGTGRLTEKLLERLPHGRVVGVDFSFNMLRTAHEFLVPRFGARIQLVQADALRLPLNNAVDAIFSTATFHWVLEHAELFRGLYAALKPGGRLVAQCGGGPNLARLHARADALRREPRFAPYFTAWTDPWEFADTAVTSRRLAEAGFEDVRTEVFAAPYVQPDADAFRAFVTTVICRPHLACLPEQALREAFIDRLTLQAAGDDPPFELDYWRLNLDARKPAS